MRAPPWLVLLLLGAAPAWAQAPAGGEFRVDTTPAFSQQSAAAAGDGRGNFVVVWHSYEAVRIQRFERTGNPLGAEMAIDVGRSNLTDPSVAMNAHGQFLVAWMRQYSGVRYFDIHGQLFDAAAAPIGNEFVVNDYTTGGQWSPTASADGRGDFVVTWESAGQIGAGYRIRGRRLSGQGVFIGSEFEANAMTLGEQIVAGVGSDATGNFVLAWSNFPGSDGSVSSVEARRFDRVGTPLGAPFRVNGGGGASSVQAGPGVGMTADGSFVISFWRDLNGQRSVLARRFTASASPLGGEFQVSSSTLGYQIRDHLAMDAAGNFVVSWVGYDGIDYGIRARRFLADGTPRGGEFVVNTSTLGNQLVNVFTPGAATDEVGNFVVAWWNEPYGPSPNGIFAQRYGGLHPSALQVDPNGNLVWEPGESVLVRPAWSNVSGAVQTPGGRLTSLTGPPGPAYTIEDGVAVYPPLADGASAACGDCYRVNVSGARPLLHWDATAIETLTPDTQGQAKRWVLHLGNSFTDVPPTSLFYRFVEALLHTGVSAGCSATTYCPGDPAARGQLAVFLLAAKEGAGFTPPPCGAPAFNDLPASSPFCPFVEELVRRGVVAGCGNGNYCPNDPVSREQMAVFLLRTLDPALSPPACTTPVFGDVPASSPFCRWVEELFRRGITAGCGGGSYCPAQPVTREQMAAFLTTTFGLTLYGV